MAGLRRWLAVERCWLSLLKLIRGQSDFSPVSGLDSAGQRGSVADHDSLVWRASLISFLLPRVFFLYPECSGAESVWIKRWMFDRVRSLRWGCECGWVLITVLPQRAAETRHTDVALSLKVGRRATGKKKKKSFHCYQNPLNLAFYVLTSDRCSSDSFMWAVPNVRRNLVF